MASVRTVRELCEQMLALESELKLLHHPIRGVKVWQLLRMSLYYALAQKTGVFSTPHANPAGFGDIVRGAIPALRDLWGRHPFRGDHTRETLVFDHGRKVLIDGEHRDIYTHHLLSTLPAGSFEVLESFHEGKHVTPRTPERRTLDALSVGSFLASRLLPIRFSAEERAFIADLERHIETRFGVALPLTQRFRREIVHFKFSVAFYRALIRKRQPRRIYLVVSYSFYKRPLIAAAKAEGVETIEIQHGTLSPYHLGYHFPEDDHLDYFPDRFLSFGEFWNTAASFPLEVEYIEPYGFPHFSNQRARFRGTERDPQQILFISQGVIGKRLSEYALACAERLPEHSVVIKLHPGEYQRWREDYPALVRAAALPNVQVVDHNQRELYAWMASSAFQVGVFSTAIYEGLAFGCRTCVVDLPGVEYMQRLIDSGHVALVGSVDALVEAIEGQGDDGPMLEAEAIFKGL